MDNSIVKAPISFKPYFKSVIWGGNKICAYKGIEQGEDNIGESWEISAVPGHVSVVDKGEYTGLSLEQLIDLFGSQLLGDKVFDVYGAKFPLLVKLIDANDNLSVQVHPDDNLARIRHNSLGKTEMWYIISADKDAKIYAGLNQHITPDIYEKKIADGTFMDVLAVHESFSGDVFFLPAGRIHAIGAGNLLAEIQESSDITYRIFDYNRKDSKGNSRELHTELAKDAIDYTLYDNYKSEISSDTVSGTKLVECSHFNVYRKIVSGKQNLTFSPHSFTVLMCIEGEISLEYNSGEMRLSKGHTVLLPAVMNCITVNGNAVLITAQA